MGNFEWIHNIRVSFSSFRIDKIMRIYLIHWKSRFSILWSTKCENSIIRTNWELWVLKFPRQDTGHGREGMITAYPHGSCNSSVQHSWKVTKCDTHVSWEGITIVIGKTSKFIKKEFINGNILSLKFSQKEGQSI